MPKKFTLNYYLTGWTTHVLYEEREMASALGLTVPELYEWLMAGAGLCYHAHPKAVGQYLFTEDAYQTNIRVFSCLTSNGHYLKPVDERKSICTQCGYERWK